MKKKILILLATSTLCISFVGCSTSAVTTAYKTESAIDTAVTASWTAWQSYVTNSKINGSPVPLATQVSVAAAFNKVKAAELLAIDATANSTNALSFGAVTSDLSLAVTDLSNLLLTFNIKL